MLPSAHARPRPRRGSYRSRAAAVAAATLLSLACADRATAPLADEAPVASRASRSVSVVPDPDRFCPFGCPELTAGDSLQYVLRVEGVAGRERFRERAKWTTSDDRVATVSPSGMVVGRAPGEAEITATVGPLSASTTVTIAAARVAKVELEAETTQLPVGGTTQLRAVVTDVLGKPMPDAPLFWFAATPNVATVDAAGTVTAVAGGDAIVMAFAEFGRSAWVSIHVTGGVAAPALGVARVDVGGTQTCAVTPAGAAYCWGWNFFGQLGDGTQGSESETFPTPVAVLGGHHFERVSAGDFHSCALASGGDAYCWGNGTSGQLGTGALGTGSALPLPVEGGHSFTALEAGGDHTCALDAQGTAYCWGLGVFGQLGIGAPASVATPSPVAGGLTYSQIATGLYSTCALTAGGTAYCWGGNEFGEVGAGKIGDAYMAQTPTKVATRHAFTTLDLRFSHACALTAAGQAFCWGRNDMGQLGDGSFAPRGRPTAVDTDLRFTAVAAGGHHSCALGADGRAYCWGNNEWGQLGDNTLTSRTSPAPVHGDVRFRSLEAGNNVTCGTTVAGDAYCWGSGHYGALGNGLQGWDTISAVPVRVAAP